ncbi:MAG: pectate lyase [Candidatus Hydrogenedentota bacterium]
MPLQGLNSLCLHSTNRFFTVLLVATLAFAPASATAEDEKPPSAEEVRKGILRAAQAFRALSYKGGYPYLISGDLETRYNAGHGTLKPHPDETYISIEPPATPSVGRSMLRAYRATGDPRLLDMAMETGDALATVQLAVGGWRMRQPLTDKWANSSVDVPGAYRITPQADLDDDRSQAPALFLVELVRDGSPSIRHREAMQKALDMFLEAQYPSGGWPQYYPLETEDGHSDLGNYRRYHHINDASIPGCIKTLLAAYRAFSDQRYRDAVVRAGDWLLEVRLPGAAWAQQYYDDFVRGPYKPNSPAPGRWFEPMAITASETGAVIGVLIELWLETGDERYAEPFGEIAAWYERSRLEDGRWARLYELHTNRPLYCTPDRIITYSDDNLRPGYAWKGTWGNKVLRTIKHVQDRGRDGMLAERDAPPSQARIRQLGLAAREALDALDERGLWVVKNGPEKENIRTDEFNRRMGQLSAYLEALKASAD